MRPHRALAAVTGAVAAAVALAGIAVAATNPPVDLNLTAEEPTTSAEPLPDAPQEPAPVALAPDTQAAAAQRIVSGRWVTKMSRRSGIPAPAVRAYGAATLVAGKRTPQCRLDWTTLAGIGWIESQHGTIGDRLLLPDGTSSTPITGPALNGTGGFAALRPHGTSQISGDHRWEHAVGPMQFIGSTWATWASDGDGNGVADPLDLDDAALAAARYLCVDGRDLMSGDSWGQAVFSYNHSEDYVIRVYDAATHYASRLR